MTGGGRVAIVTGAGSGIGRATAIRLGAEGFHLALIDVSQAGLHETASSIDRDPLLLTVDVGDRGQVIESVDRVSDELGTPTALVNAAGILHRAPAADHGLEEWRQTMAVNLDGPFWLSQAVIRSLIAREMPGAIVNVVSIEALYPLKDHIAYSVSKGALLMQTKAVALDVAPLGIRVNAVCPGVIETRMNRDVRADPEASANLRAQIPMGRFGDPSEVADVIVFLLSEGARYMTGAVLLVDGGWAVH
jgi:NAD(P)-dependent dehydrogenase (short-subunit alcohol dehydrogenase family)